MDERQPQPVARAPLPDAWWRLSLRTRRRIAAGIALGIVAVPVAVIVLVTSGGDSTQTDPDEFVAALPPSKVEVWDELAQCESSGRWDADTGNGYYGGLQFTQSSWGEVGGSGNPAHTSREEQIMRAESLLDLQGWGAWPVCSDQLGLG